MVPNVKGQIVIPQEIRKSLGITAKAPLNLIVRGGGIYLYPIEEVLTGLEGESAYLAILERTQGSWVSDKTWEETAEKRSKIELAASLKRKKAW